MAAENEDPARAFERALDLGELDVDLGIAPDAHHPPRHLAGKARARGIVDVDDGGRSRLARRGQQLEEQPGLGGVVRVEVAVEIEMVARQVAEGRGVEAETVRAGAAPGRATTPPWRRA